MISIDINNNILNSTNHEVQVGNRPSYANEVHNEGTFILDSNVDAFIGAPNEEDVRPPVEVNEESKIVENYSSIIPHDYSLDIRKFDRMQENSRWTKPLPHMKGVRGPHLNASPCLISGIFDVACRT